MFFFHYIKFPEIETLKKIVNVHFPKIKKSLLDSALKTFFEIREVPGLKKASTSEALDWIKLSSNRGSRSFRFKN